MVRSNWHAFCKVLQCESTGEWPRSVCICLALVRGETVMSFWILMTVLGGLMVAAAIVELVVHWKNTKQSNKVRESGRDGPST